MVSINTNLSSLMVQSNLNKSTNALNQAIERMTTGFKLNHSSDNAAGYSIAENMTSKLSSYDVATDNISMGMDMVSTAQDSISLMQTHAERIHSLINQSMNGTYGKTSQKAIVSEINARISEITRLYGTTEYNGISLFNNKKIDMPENIPQAGESGFIDESALSGAVMVKETGFIRALSDSVVDGIKDSYTDDEIAAMTNVKDLTSFTSGQTYAITDKEDLIKLAELQNSGNSTSNVTFVLGTDINLEGIDWKPIGDSNTDSNETRFCGTFNGNGHVISNITVNNPESNYQGLFGVIYGGKIRNLGIENANISGYSQVGALAGLARTGAKIDNCYAKSDINSYGEYAGGLIGHVYSNSSVSNSYSESTVNGSGDWAGGLIGYCLSKISVTNCYSESTVNGADRYVGGLIGRVFGNSSVSNSYAISTVSGQGVSIGGCVGSFADSNISNCYSDSIVYGNKNAGGFIGATSGNSTIDSCYSLGSVNGNTRVGGFVGITGANASVHPGTTTITNSSSFCTDVLGQKSVGSFIGEHTYQSEQDNGGLAVTNCSSVNLDNLEMVGKVSSNNYDLASLLEQIQGLDIISRPTDLQVGINGDDSSCINFDTNFDINLIDDLSRITKGGRVNFNAYSLINDFLDQLSSKATTLGAVSNRLESALESTSVAMENLTSSLSTIRDADISKESSAYIRQQILQQASATLLATVNQSPAIALQLI